MAMKSIRVLLTWLFCTCIGLHAFLYSESKDAELQSKQYCDGLNFSFYYTLFDGEGITYKGIIVTPSQKFYETNELYYFDQIETLTLPAPLEPGVYTIVFYVNSYKSTTKTDEFARANVMRRDNFDLSTFVVPLSRIYAQGEQVAFQYVVTPQN
jgi:hypothetical protein